MTASVSRTHLLRLRPFLLFHSAGGKGLRGGRKRGLPFRSSGLLARAALGNPHEAALLSWLGFWGLVGLLVALAATAAATTMPLLIIHYI
jgi:hypothetical protein